MGLYQRPGSYTADTDDDDYDDDIPDETPAPAETQAEPEAASPASLDDYPKLLLGTWLRADTDFSVLHFYGDGVVDAGNLYYKNAGADEYEVVSVMRYLITDNVLEVDTNGDVYDEDREISCHEACLMTFDGPDRLILQYTSQGQLFDKYEYIRIP